MKYGYYSNYARKKKFEKYKSILKDTSDIRTKIETKRRKKKRTLDWDEFTNLRTKLSELGFTNLQQYIDSALWALKRKEKFGSSMRLCAACKKKGKLFVHHRTYKNLGAEKMKDLVILCNPCHYKIHDYVKRGFKLEKATRMVLKG